MRIFFLRDYRLRKIFSSRVYFFFMCGNLFIYYFALSEFNDNIQCNAYERIQRKRKKIVKDADLEYIYIYIIYYFSESIIGPYCSINNEDNKKIYSHF